MAYHDGIPHTCTTPHALDTIANAQRSRTYRISHSFANFCQIKLEIISFAQVHISRYFPIFTFLMLLQISYEHFFTPRQKVFFFGWGNDFYIFYDARRNKSIFVCFALHLSCRCWWCTGGNLNEF